MRNDINHSAAERRRPAVNVAEKLERLRLVEFSRRVEPYVRLAAIALAGFLVYLYTGWISALVWPCHFILSFIAHEWFVRSHRAFGTRRNTLIAALLFANLQGAYTWLPAIMTASLDRPLMLVGAALLCAQMVFLLRRSDTLVIYAITQVAVTACMSLYLYFAFMPYYTSPLAYVGCALALLALNFYFANSLSVARRLRLQSEETARQSMQAQKMAAIGQLAGGVAHDFNNNLTAIIGSLELLEVTDDPKEQHIDIENALVAARQAAQTVKQLLIYARMDRQDLTRVPIETLIDELRSLTQRLIPATVTLDLRAPDPGLVVMADRPQLITALVNLVLNGVDAMPEGGTLTLCALTERIDRPRPMADGSRLAPGAYVCLTVRDTGTGIPPEILTKVLEPFFTTKPVGKGTGLGLSMVQGMSRELGGGLALQSGAEGTTVRLYLPRV